MIISAAKELTWGDDDDEKKKKERHNGAEIIAAFWECDWLVDGSVCVITYVSSRVAYERG